jgi:hypothetical protein
MNLVKNNKFKTHLLITYPSGADYVSCPLCSNYNDYLTCDYSYNKEIDDTLKYCDKCNNIFAYAHTYKSEGCTDDEDHAMLINKYIYDGNEYEGYPTFLNLETAQKLINSGKLKIISMKCTCNGRKSEDCHYPESKYPEYYEECPGEKIVDIKQLKCS